VTINEMIELRKAAAKGPWVVVMMDGVWELGPVGPYERSVLVGESPEQDGKFIAACGNFDWEAVRDVVEAAAWARETQKVTSWIACNARVHAVSEHLHICVNAIDRLDDALARLKEGE